jgi:hypothetical protein
MTRTQRDLLWCTAGTTLVFALLSAGGLLAASETPKTQPRQQTVAPTAVPKNLSYVEATKRGLDKHTMKRMHNTLYTEDGRKLLAFDTGKGYALYQFSKGRRVAAPDGLYKIRGGGQLRANAGRITWADKTIELRFPNPAYVGAPIVIAQREAGIGVA